MSHKVTNANRADWIKTWIKALRSGEWKQSRMRYHGRNGGHCCLGVAQIVLGLPKEESASRLRTWLNLTYENEINYLIKLNDNSHRNFAYIADKIEEKILPRFLTK
jgi:hypothetical protein